MGTDAREFIEFWVENSVHAAEERGTAGGEQSANKLAYRCIEAAKGQGLSKSDLEAAVGDLTEFMRAELKRANTTASDRTGS